MNNVQQMMALAARRQRSASVGGCGPYAQNPDDAGGMVPCGDISQGVAGCVTVPGPNGPLVQPGALEQYCQTPLGIVFGVDVNGMLYRKEAIGAPVSASAPLELGFEIEVKPRVGTFSIAMLRAWSLATRGGGDAGPGIAKVTSITGPGGDYNFALNGFDVSAYSTETSGCPCNFGCASTVEGLKIQARSVDLANPATIRGIGLVFWGVSTRAQYACGPAL